MRQTPVPLACDYQLDGVEMVKLNFCVADFKKLFILILKEKQSFQQKKSFKTLKNIFKEKIIQDFSSIETKKEEWNFLCYI